MYYSTAVYKSLDATQIALLLSGCEVKVKQRSATGQIVEKAVPVSQVVEPQPIRYVVSHPLRTERRSRDTHLAFHDDRLPRSLCTKH